MTEHQSPAGPAIPPRTVDWLQTVPPQLTRYVAPAVGVFAALLVVVGSFMPWATAQTIFGTMSVAGTDGDGKLFLAGGLVLATGAVLATVFPHLALRIWQFAAATGATIFAGLELVHVTTELRDQSSQFAVASVGSGLYVLLVGTVAATVAATVHMFQR